MPFSSDLENTPKALEYLYRFLEELPLDFLFWKLDDFDDLGSFRLLYTAHGVVLASGANLVPYLGKPMREIFPMLLDTEVPARYREVLLTGKPWELPALRYGDNLVPEREYRLVAYQVDKDLIGLIAENVTDKVRAEHERNAAMRALESKARELERSNHDLEAFAYVASHDLRSPLRDIESLASWIHEDAGELMPPAAREYLQRLRDRVARMQRLLGDLLEYSRAGRVTENVVEVDVLAVLHNARELIAAPPGFTVIIPPSAPVVHTSRAPLLQIFINLMGNAVKHHGGDSGRVEVSWREVGERIEFSVADDGPGIAQRFHERVFQLFTTLKPRDEVEGSGMGLALVKRLVELHGGEITLTSAEGQGSTFRFTWPRKWSQAQVSP